MKFRQVALAIGVSLVAAGAVAQQFKPEDQIKYRQAAFTVMARSFTLLGGMAKGDIPYNKEAAVENAQVVATMARVVANGFTPGSDKGAPTRADAKIWGELQQFKAAHDKLLMSTAKLPAAAADQSSLRAAVGEVGASCKGCHDSYRLSSPRS